MSPFTIYHNPDCGTSRNTLALLRAAGLEPTVIEYLKTPPDLNTLRSLIQRMGMTVRDVLRTKGTPYQALGLDDPSLGDERLLLQMRLHPLLINRPIVVCDRGVLLCRPSDLVLDLLPEPPTGHILKEEGTPFLQDAPIPGGDPSLQQALGAAGLPTDDLNEPGRRFFRFTTLAGERVGFGGFERMGREVLVRSLVALPEARHRGLGSAMLALLLRRAFDEGGREAWLLTTTARPFFERAGFTAIDRSLAPASILGTRQAAALCPASAALLRRSLHV